MKLDSLSISSNRRNPNYLTVIGRRRVGKTFLIREVNQSEITFEFTGTQNGSKNNQLRKFADKFAEFLNINLPLQAPKD